jgi:predicted Zn-ribbon and HTH transcriptional regulator
MALKVHSYKTYAEAKEAANNLTSAGYRVTIREERDSIYGEQRCILYVATEDNNFPVLNQPAVEKTKIMCFNCGWQWYTRSKKPLMCPRCKGENIREMEKQRGSVRSAIRRLKRESDEPVEDDDTYTQKFFVQNPDFLEID